MPNPLGERLPDRADREEEEGAPSEDERDGEYAFHIHSLVLPWAPPTYAEVPEMFQGATQEGAQTSSTASMAPSETAISVSSLPAGRR